MVSKPKACYVMFITAILFMVAIEEASGCNNDLNCLYAKETSTTKFIKSRKVLALLKGTRGLHAPTRIDNGEKVVARELRTAPSGPDPLHHHGGSPKKPRSDP